MEPISANLKVTRTARYFMLGDNTLPIDTLIFVLHGYGMQAKTFLCEFEALVKPGVLIVAPEGLSRFYRKGFAGDVVSSWMTKEDRLFEIEDYVNYLDDLHRKINPSGKARIIVLGFSQGTSAASRWLSKGTANISELILWCGEFAKDAELTSSKPPVIRHVIALQDEFIPVERFAEESAWLGSKFKELQEYKFDGPHAIDKPTLLTVFKDVGI